VSATRFLVLAVILLLVVWSTSATGLVWRVPAFARQLVGLLFVLCAVRLGLSIAILAFGLSPASYLIPILLGVIAWRLRPGRGESA